VAPEHEGWSADCTAIVALRVSSGAETLTIHHVVTPLGGHYVVSEVLLDLDEIAEMFLRPI
jgi:hypothetical protein